MSSQIFIRPFDYNNPDIDGKTFQKVLEYLLHGITVPAESYNQRYLPAIFSLTLFQPNIFQHFIQLIVIEIIVRRVFTNIKQLCRPELPGNFNDINVDLFRT